MSRRTERIASLIRSVLAEAIQQRLNDPRIARLTSITHVDVAADLSLARVYVSVMAADAGRQLSVTALRHAARRLRAMVAEQIELRQMPQLEFHLDDSIRGSFQTVQQIDRIMDELGARPEARETEDAEAAADAGAPDPSQGPRNRDAGAHGPHEVRPPDACDRALDEDRRTPER